MNASICRFFCVLLLPLIITSCDFLLESDEFIKLYCTNSSDQTIHFSFVDNGRATGVSFNDSGISLNNYKEFFRQVEPDTTALIFIKRGITWEEMYPDSVQIYIWNDATVKQVGWETVLRYPESKGYFECELVLSVEDLSTLDYTIPYPLDGPVLDMRIIEGKYNHALEDTDKE